MTTSIHEVVGRLVSKDVQRTDSRFEQEKRRLLEELEEVGLDVLAIHEAGHEHYYFEVGARNITYEPPVVLFRRDNYERPFKRQLAGVRISPPYEKPSNMDDLTWLFKLAKGCAAGGVCCEKLTESRYRGDPRDRKLWIDICIAHYGLSWPKEKIDAFANADWEKAKETVSEELKSEDLKIKIQTRAKEVKHRLFPWLHVHE